MSYKTRASIKDNLQSIKERIESACVRSGRDPGDVRLVVVTKRVNIERIREAVEAGADILGENYVQEAKNKIDFIDNSKVEWHLIGHLQRNKAREAVQLFKLIHSIDNLRLAEILNKKAEMSGRRLRVFIQVNLSGEKTKHGIVKNNVIELVSAISELKNLSIDGLMSLPPYFEDKEDVRPYFIALRKLREGIKDETGILLKELSMGMSHDFEVAIEEGATMVRIGSAIFGQRL